MAKVPILAPSINPLPMRTIVFGLVLIALAPAAGAQRMPNFKASPLYGDIVLESGFTPDPYTVRVRAGGGVDNPIDGPGCVGNIADSQPDVTLTYSADGSWDLAFYVESDVDTALLIRSPDGQWTCNDDSDGLDPRLAFQIPQSGAYHVWVATYGDDTADATLNISESYRSDLSPDHRAAPLYSRVTLSSGFTPDPYTVQVTAGGADPNPIDGPGCVGYIASAQPDVVVDYSAGSIFDLAFYVDSDRDTALLIRSPDGAWTCNDDHDGLDPRVEFASPRSGAYAVWIASYGDESTTATLGITEYSD